MGVSGRYPVIPPIGPLVLQVFFHHPFSLAPDLFSQERVTPFSQMEAVKHFVTWTSQNLNPIPIQSEPYLDFNDMAIHYQSPSSLLCVSNKDSLCLGYAKVFQYLCEKAGIRCDIVLGTRRTNQGGHAINKIYFGDEGFYVDVSELRNANFINYMTQQKAKAYMAPAYPELF